MTGIRVFRQWVPSFLLFVSMTFLATVSQAQLAIAPSSVSFGNVLVGNTQTQWVSVSNVGSSNIYVSQLGASGTGYTAQGVSLPFTLSPGQKVSVQVVFTPPAVGSDSGRFSASGSMTSGGSSNWGRHRWRNGGWSSTSASASLSGAGISSTGGAGAITASPASLAFGSIMPGTSQTLMETLKNTGTTSVTISGASLSSGSFTVSGLTLPMTLQGGQSATFAVVFAPTAGGTNSGTLAIASNASNSVLSIGLSGSGAAAGQLQLTPTALNFGNVVTGASATLNGALSASGSSVTISGATLSSTEFSVSGISLPMTLAAGQTAAYTVTFLPNATGSTSGTLAFASNASNSTVKQTLSGSGTAAAQHTVNLSWTPSSTQSVVSYNVYRSGASGGPYAQLTSADANASWSDASVSAGQTYYYVVTSVDGTGTESAYSNQAKAVIPTP